jgi:hypothetical protein
MEPRLPVLPLFQHREVAWRRWSSAVPAVPLERILQDQERTSKFSLYLSQEPLEEIKKKEIIIAFKRQSLSLTVPLFPIWT